jgi:membrane protein required for colicin V production
MPATTSRHAAAPLASPVQCGSRECRNAVLCPRACSRQTGSSMNSFDAVVSALAMVAVITGFNAGILRSLATILGYVSAMPIAVGTTSFLSGTFGHTDAPWAENSLLFFGVFLGTGMVLGALLRAAVNETVGSDIGIVDRLAGSALGAGRIGLVAVTMVVIFDQLIPADREPAFLSGSRLRPILSIAGRSGLKSLPPDVAAYIDRLKQNRRI